MTAPAWEWMDAEARRAYERERGVQPPGFRATGSWHWFERHHPDTAPCGQCGTVTDRWAAVNVRVGLVSHGTPHVDQPMRPAELPDKKRALCWDFAPFCQRCEDRHSLAVLEARQLDLAILPALRAQEAMEIAALRAAAGEPLAVERSA